MDDKISVIMACYNCSATLRKAIDSILAQTYPNWIMICCDDGSTDNTLEILHEYEVKDPQHFLIIQNESNKKLPYSLNHCLKYVTTDFVARMDADDWSDPERFEKQIEFLKEHPEYDLVGTGVRISNGKDELTTIVQPQKPEPHDLLNCNCFSHATIMTYKRVYDELKGYSLDPNAERCEDIELWSRFFAAGFRGYNLQETLYNVLENEDAIRRRSLQNRLKAARTLMASYKRLNFHGFICFRKAYFQVLTYFVPKGLYKRLHIWRMTQRTKRNGRNDND